MPNRVQLDSLDVCTRAAAGGMAAMLLLVASPAAAQVTTFGSAFKVAFYNIQSGKGEPGLPGHPTPFADSANCTDTSQPLNAWGLGIVQQELTASIGNDPSVIALGLAEAWTSVCASPERVRQALGWAARSASTNGLAIVARHGFSGSVTALQLDTSQSTDTEPRYVAHARVCVDAACSGTMDVFATHMAASGPLRDASMTTQVTQILAFMTKQAGSRPRVLVGDFNLYDEPGAACAGAPWPKQILDNLRSAGYKDAWRTLRGTAAGYTGMTNRRGCGEPEGSTYKRIDYAWSLNLVPMSVQLFGNPPPGDPAPSDHYGLVAEYWAGGSVPPPDTTGPVVSLTSPASSATVGGTVTIAASATDASGVARVEFLVNGSVVGADATAPYSAQWDTTAAANGTRTLQARAVDAAGNSSLTSLRTVTVSNVVPGPVGVYDEAVMYASRAAVSGTRWTIGDDASAASGRVLLNANLGASKASGASAAPADYAELTFRADKGRGYRLWVRGRAANNGWANDSVFVQFSDSVDAAGAARWRIGTTSSTTVQIEEGVGAGLSGWGWADNGYDADGALVYFQSTGDHTIRLQVREDGLSIDQIVLSAVTYLAAAPGASKDDGTVVPLPGAAGGGPVTSYDATTDRLARPEPPLPVIGAAGFRFADPTFGSRILRVTDAGTRPGAAGRSFKTPSAAHQNAWNTTSTYFYVMSTGGAIVPFAFDPSTMTASRLDPTASGDGGRLLRFHGDPQFSYVHENVIYGVSTSALRTIQEYDFETDVYSPLLDLQTLGADLSGTYVGGVLSSAGPVEKILAWYGGASQDRHFRVVVFERDNPSRRRLLDTLASTIDGRPTTTMLNFKLHHVEIDRSGRYVMLSPTGADRNAPRYAEVEYIWDMETDVITPLDEVDDVAGGHKALGYGALLNKGCCTSTAWDAAQWQFRSLASPTVTRDLISPVLLPKQIQMSDHVSWNNAQPGAPAPVITALYRYGNNTVEWRAWDDEIVGVKTEGTGSTVWRFAHHRSNVASDTDPAASYFNYMPRVNVSQDGRWAIFTSNWEKALGVDSGVTSRTEYRQDVFLVDLAGSAVSEPPPPPNQPPSVSIAAPASGATFSAGATIVVSAAAADADGTVARVEFRINGNTIVSDTAAPYAASWKPAAAGSYSLTAVAVDDDGASKTSGAIAVTVVAAPNAPPVASLTAPQAGSVIAAGETVTVTASAADADGSVQRVDFYANTTLIGRRTAPPWSVTWTPTFGATVNLRAVAIDNLGAIASSPVVAITVVSDVVIYAGDATRVAGSYQFVSDASAAGGRRLLNPNSGAARVPAPLAAPASYIEFTFHALAGQPYHLWIRGRAEKDGWANDSAFVQFSGSVDGAGGGTHRIGSTSGLVFQVEEGSGAGLSGWGWQDSSYGALAEHVYFETTGPQRIRLQPREDGLSIDQIVISPAAWLETRPGATKGDTTIVGR